MLRSCAPQGGSASRAHPEDTRYGSTTPSRHDTRCESIVSSTRTKTVPRVPRVGAHRTAIRYDRTIAQPHLHSYPRCDGPQATHIGA